MKEGSERSNRAPPRLKSKVARAEVTFDQPEPIVELESNAYDEQAEDSFFLHGANGTVSNITSDPNIITAPNIMTVPNNIMTVPNNIISGSNIIPVPNNRSGSNITVSSNVRAPNNIGVQNGAVPQMKTTRTIIVAVPVPEEENSTSARPGSGQRSAEEKVPPRHKKSLRSFVDRPKSQHEKKDTIRARANTEAHYAEKCKAQPAVVLNTEPVDMGNFSYFHGSNRDESLQQVSLRRRSLNKDRAIAANMYNARLRLKCYSEDKPKKQIPKKRQQPSAPLVIPPAYAQLFIREYGSNYSTLEEASIDYHRKRSASRERNVPRRSSLASESRLGSRSACDTKPSTRRLTNRKVIYQEVEVEVNDDDGGEFNEIEYQPIRVRDPREFQELNRATSQKIRAALFNRL